MLDDGFEPDPCALLVIGCGNILRGDDAAGPVLIRRLFTRGVPDGVRLVDGGTAGMDVAFAMRGASRVVIVDASSTAAQPGTLYRVPADELTDLPMDGLHSHNFRWDHALALSTWLLGPQRPTDITVFLIEAESYEPGAELSPAVDAGVEQVAAMLERDFYPADSHQDTVELTADGYLHLSAELAASRFPHDVLVAALDGSDLILVPLRSPANGGLVLRQRNAAGERTVLIHEVFDFAQVPGGTFDAEWDAARGALIVRLAGPFSGAGS